MDKERFSSGEVLKMLDISRMALRYYMRKGLVSGTVDAENGYHSFDRNDIMDLVEIAYLRQRLDFSTDEIRDYLDASSLEDYILLMEEHSRMLAEEIERKQRQQKVLENWSNLLTEVMTYGSRFEVIDYPQSFRLLKFSPEQKDAYWQFYNDAANETNIIYGCDIFRLEENNFVLDAFGVYLPENISPASFPEKPDCTEELLPAGKYLYGLFRGRKLPYEGDAFCPVWEYVEKHDVKLLPHAYSSVYMIDRRSSEREFIYDVMIPLAPEVLPGGFFTY